MQIDECTTERLAIMEYDGKMSRAEAQRIYEQSQHVSEDHYSDKVKRLRELATLQRMSKHHRVSMKSKAAGE